MAVRRNYFLLEGLGSKTYMKRSLSVDVCAIDIHFVVVQEGDAVVNVSMLNRVEHDVRTDFLYMTYHNLNYNLKLNFTIYFN